MRKIHAALIAIFAPLLALAQTVQGPPTVDYGTTPVAGHCWQVGSRGGGQMVDSGSACGGGGSGTVSSGTIGQPAVYTGSTTVGGLASAPTTITCGPIAEWFKVGNAISHTAFQTAATTNSIALFTLPANCIIHSTFIDATTAFAGTSISAYTLSVGIGGSVARYASAFDVLQTAGPTVWQLSVGPFLESTAGTTAVLVTATSTGANLSASTAGVVNVYVQLSSAN